MSGMQCASFGLFVIHAPISESDSQPSPYSSDALKFSLLSKIPPFSLFVSLKSRYDHVKPLLRVLLELLQDRGWIPQSQMENFWHLDPIAS